MHPTLNGIEQSQQDKADLIAYAKQPLGFLLLSGKNGTGKSYAAEAIYNANTTFRLPDYDWEASYFLNASDLYFYLQDNFGDAAALAERRYRCKNTKLLVLDDLCSNNLDPKPHFTEFLYTVIEHRWRERNKLGTIITTNVGSEDFQKKLGDAILSRVCSGKVKRWDFKDRRLNAF